MKNNEQSKRKEKSLVDFGQQIKKLRIAKQLSQEQLGLRTQLDRTYISGIERGVRNVGVINVFRIARALNVSPSELFDFSAK